MNNIVSVILPLGSCKEHKTHRHQHQHHHHHPVMTDDASNALSLTTAGPNIICINIISVIIILITFTIMMLQLTKSYYNPNCA